VAANDSFIFVNVFTASKAEYSFISHHNSTADSQLVNILQQVS